MKSTINKKEADKILRFIKLNGFANITQIENQTKLARCRVRSLICFLLGRGDIEERDVGMSKCYFLKKGG
ncbi:MAG: hypothetical protein ACFE85_19390 [Candidatus Hodarchaeota archaeon]